MYECMNVWMYECVNVWMYVWMYECMNVWMYEWMYVCMYVLLNKCVYAHQTGNQEWCYHFDYHSNVTSFLGVLDKYGLLLVAGSFLPDLQLRSLGVKLGYPISKCSKHRWLRLTLTVSRNLNQLRIEKHEKHTSRKVLQNKPLRAVAKTLFGFFAQLFVQVFHLHMPKTPTCLQWHGRIYKTLTINIYIL